MATRKETIEVNVTGADKGARDIGKLDNATDRLGDEFRDLARDASKLDRQLEDLRRTQQRLASEFARTGDLGLQKQFAAANRQASALARMQKTLAGAAKAAGPTSGGARAAVGGLSLPLSPQMLAGAGIAGAIAAPAIGAGISAAGLLAGGLGVAGGGAAIAAASSEHVQAVYSTLGQQIAQDATRAAKAFERPLLESAEIVRDSWADVSDDVSELFKEAAGSAGLQGFAKGLAGFVEQLLPGLKAAAEVFGEFGEIGRQALPELAKSLTVMFQQFERGSDGATAFFHDLIILTGKTAEGIGNVSMALSKVYEFLDEGRDRSLYGQLTMDVTGFSKAIGEGTHGAEEFHAALVDGTKDLESYEDQLDRIVKTTLDLVGANLSYEESLDELAETLKENGRHWDIGTEKGRENIEAVKDSIEAAYRQREAMIATGQSTAYADEWFRKAKDSIIAQAQAAGATAKSIGELTAMWDAFLARQSTKILNVKVVESSAARVGTGAARAGTLPFYASGTTSARAGYAVVGEEGPEIVKFRGGEQVYSHAESKQMAAGPGGSREPFLIRVRVEYPDGRVARDQLIDAAANRGQSMNSFLGV